MTAASMDDESNSVLVLCLMAFFRSWSNAFTILIIFSSSICCCFLGFHVNLKTKNVSKCLQCARQQRAQLQKLEQPQICRMKFNGWLAITWPNRVHTIRYQAIDTISKISVSVSHSRDAMCIWFIQFVHMFGFTLIWILMGLDYGLKLIIRYSQTNW